MPIDPSKICAACHERKPLTAFTKSKQNKDGRHSYCLKCKTAQQRERIARDPEKYKKKQAEYDKRYAQNHPDRVARRKREWNALNQERIKNNQIRWIENNREKVRLYVRMSNARRRANGGRNSYKFVDEMMKSQHGLCVVCKKKMGKIFHIDHILPLKLGGTNDVTNLQLLCPRCNLVKRDMHPVDFMQSRGYLL